MKVLSLFFILGFLSYNLAQDCNNPLLDVFNLNGLSAPVSGQGLPFCSNLQNGQTCCSADTLNGLQANLDGLSRRLEAIAGQKDIYIAQLNTNFSSQYQSVMGFVSDLGDYLGRLELNVSDVGAPIRSQTNLFQEVSNALDDIDDSFSRALIAYQERRTICFNTLLQVQASAWCLACDPNYATLGVQEDGTITPDANLCNTIGNACGPFLDQGIFLNALFNAQQSFARLNNIRAFLDAYRVSILTSGGSVPDLLFDNDILSSNNATERTVSRPATPANWQCVNLFSSSFVLNEEIAGNGAGLIGGADFNLLGLPAIGVLPVVIPPVTEVENPIEEVIEVVEEVIEVIEEVTEVVEETVTEVITEVEETVTEVITEVEETVTEVITEVEETVTEVITEVGETVTEVGETVTEVVSEVTETVNEVTETVTEVISEVGETITEVLETETITQQGAGNRLLQASTWNPDVATTGYNIAVVQDPGNVTNFDEGDESDPDNAAIDDHLNDGLAGSRVTITGSILVGTVLLAALI